MRLESANLLMICCYCMRNVGELAHDVKLRPLDNQRLPLRNQFGLTWGKLLHLLPRQILALRFIVSHFLRKAAP